MVHCNHYDHFGYLFPPMFKNWFSDAWISLVYSSNYTFLLPRVLVINMNFNLSNGNSTRRYEAVSTDKSLLEPSLLQGASVLKQFICAHTSLSDDARMRHGCGTNFSRL